MKIDLRPRCEYCGKRAAFENYKRYAPYCCFDHQERARVCDGLEYITSQGYTSSGGIASEDKSYPQPDEETASRDILANEVLSPQDIERDAARYRWLRQQHWSEAPLCVVMRPKDAVKLGHECPTLERLDAAIDKAMKED